MAGCKTTNFIHRWTAVAGLVSAAMLIIACASSELTPAPAAKQPSGTPNTAVDNVDGVFTRVEAGAMPSSSRLADSITPLRVSIENNSDMPIRVRYREFALVGPDGQYYSALPPVAASDNAEQQAPAAGVEPVDNGHFRHSGFYVSPSFHHAYGGLPVWMREFHHDATYHDTYYTSYEALKAAAGELRERALPEGVIAPGGDVSGYLYFEPVDAGLPQVQFRADLVNANTGKTIGSLSIPFTVGSE